MLAAVKGVIHGNTIVLEDDDIQEYDGAEVIITLLNYPFKKDTPEINLKKYMGRGDKLFHADAQNIIKEMRDHDRI